MSKATDVPEVVYVGSNGDAANTWHTDPDCAVLDQATEIIELDSLPTSANPCAYCTDRGVTAQDLREMGENATEEP